MWGFLNEGEANLWASREAYQQLATFTKQKDASRLVSWASRQLRSFVEYRTELGALNHRYDGRHKLQDKTLDLADVIAFNDYPGQQQAFNPVVRHAGDRLVRCSRVRNSLHLAEICRLGSGSTPRPSSQSKALLAGLSVPSPR